jgi:hypothetical protein
VYLFVVWYDHGNGCAVGIKPLHGDVAATLSYGDKPVAFQYLDYTTRR